MDIRERANDLFTFKDKERYNCCQAIVCAYCEQYGIDDENIFKMTEGFGLGMGGLRDTCGAVTGMFMAMGLHNSAGDKKKPSATKADTYKAIREYAKKFREECGGIYCCELKLVVDGKQAVPCETCVDTAAKLLEEYIASKI